MRPEAEKVGLWDLGNQLGRKPSTVQPNTCCGSLVLLAAANVV